MKVKTSELIDLALDWAVAKCEQLSGNSGKLKICPPLQVSHLLVDTSVWLGGVECRYSTYWEQGGPIIERERIQVFPHNGASEWCGVIHVPRNGYTGILIQDGSTPLIAAMRCYCASKLGDEVEIPEELK